MLIIPAIDIIGGQCVRLTKGDYDTVKVYGNDPLMVARQFEDKGFTHLHLVDLDGAKAGEVVNWQVLEAVAEGTSLKVDFSGGIKTKAAVEKVFSLGAAQVAIGSLAVKDPEMLVQWLETFGAARFVLAADVNDRMVATHGWQQQSGQHIHDFLAFWLSKGLNRVLCTDISKDGMLQGPALDLYIELLAAFPQMELIASGGVSSMEDISQLSAVGCYAAVVGKAIYEGRIGLDELSAEV
jgi:phosphoribosylformimino-5-aminoimidazole carboxamide ribotide isomerase